MADLRAQAPSSTRQPQRVDARRNRQRLLAAADAVFTENGPYAALDDIAKQAGVGNATLYRHFPTRQDLMVAVYWGEVEVLRETADGLADAPVASEALVDWLQAFVRHMLAKRGLAGALVESIGDERSPILASYHDAIHAAGEPLLVRAQQAGEVREDINLDELLWLTSGIARRNSGSDEIIERAGRLLRILMEGIYRR
jgi:AcrR family transcriptional regulator